MRHAAGTAGFAAPALVLWNVLRIYLPADTYRLQSLRVLLALLAGLAVALSASALWLATRSQTFTYVMLDGRAVRMLVAGGGDATVVLENGCCPALETWGKVQAEIARFATTVACDRAGLGLSGDGPAPRDGRTIAIELHRTLELAGFASPYVLVGASLGGPYIRVFAGLYPSSWSKRCVRSSPPRGAEFEYRPRPRAASRTAADRHKATPRTTRPGGYSGSAG